MRSAAPPNIPPLIYVTVNIHESNKESKLFTISPDTHTIIVGSIWTTGYSSYSKGNNLKNEKNPVSCYGW